MLGSGGLGALIKTHNSHDHLQQVYYIQWQTRKWDSEVSRASVLRVSWPCSYREQGKLGRYFLHILFVFEGHGVNILVLTLSSCAAFCSCSLLQLGAVPIPACRLFVMAVLMSNSHRLLIIHSPYLLVMSKDMTAITIRLAYSQLSVSMGSGQWIQPTVENIWRNNCVCTEHVQIFFLVIL
jgi:hypothetical protein